jgi:hypothetical protein
MNPECLARFRVLSIADEVAVRSLDFKVVDVSLARLPLNPLQRRGLVARPRCDLRSRLQLARFDPALPFKEERMLACRLDAQARRTLLLF